MLHMRGDRAFSRSRDHQNYDPKGWSLYIGARNVMGLKKGLLAFGQGT